jgi:hypothetical protein
MIRWLLCLLGFHELEFKPLHGGAHVRVCKHCEDWPDWR